jgi:hypothetical protein
VTLLQVGTQGGNVLLDELVVASILDHHTAHIHEGIIAVPDEFTTLGEDKAVAGDLPPATVPFSMLVLPALPQMEVARLPTVDGRHQPVGRGRPGGACRCTARARRPSWLVTRGGCGPVVRGHRRVDEHVHLLADEDRQVAPREAEDHLQHSRVDTLGAVAGE